MATAYVKNASLNFYSSPSDKALITKIERSGQTEPYFLNGFSEGDELGVLTGNEENGFVEIEHPFDIRRKLTSKSKWYWIFPPAGIAASQLSQWSHETELIWVLQEDISDDSPAQVKAAQKKAKTQQLIEAVDTPSDATLTAANSQTGKSNGLLIGAIAALALLIIGIIVWALRKKKTPPAATAVTQIPPIAGNSVNPKKAI